MCTILQNGLVVLARKGRCMPQIGEKTVSLLHLRNTSAIPSLGFPSFLPMERTEQDVYLRVDDAVKKEDYRTALAVGNCLSF